MTPAELQAWANPEETLWAEELYFLREVERDEQEARLTAYLESTGRSRTEIDTVLVEMGYGLEYPQALDALYDQAEAILGGGA